MLHPCSMQGLSFQPEGKTFQDVSIKMSIRVLKHRRDFQSGIIQIPLENLILCSFSQRRDQSNQLWWERHVAADGLWFVTLSRRDTFIAAVLLTVGQFFSHLKKREKMVIKVFLGGIKCFCVRTRSYFVLNVTDKILVQPSSNLFLRGPLFGRGKRNLSNNQRCWKAPASKVLLLRSLTI